METSKRRIRLKEPLELKDNGYFRQHLLDLHHFPEATDADFVNVVFENEATICIDFKQPTRRTFPMRNEFRIADPDGINDTENLSHEQQMLLKSNLNQEFLHQLQDFVIFPLHLTYCPKSDLSQSLSTLEIPRKNPWTVDEESFCWLQILPLIKSYPYKYFKNEIKGESYLVDVRVLVRDATVFFEKYTNLPRHSMQLKTESRTDEEIVFDSRNKIDFVDLEEQLTKYLASGPTFLSYLSKFARFCMHKGYAYVAQKGQIAKGRNSVNYLWYT